jgi:phosphate transport system substrate-binding protein
LLCLIVAAPAIAGTLKIGGTGAALGGLTRLGEAYEERYPGDDVEIVTGLGSSGGVRAVLAGVVDIGVTSRPLREKEVRAGAAGRDYAKTAFVFATDAGNEADNVTLDQLATIYRGERAFWPDGSPIRLVLRPKTDSDTEILANLSTSLAEAVEVAHGRVGLKIAPTDQDAADAIENLPGALSTSTLALIRAEDRAIKPLALDGVHPTADNLRKGAYALFKTFFLVTGPTVSADAQRFIDFVQSPEAEKILSDVGHIVVSHGLGS